ncbi:MAG: type II secretion system F family protein [Solirubrobacterales bacterium]
MTGDLAVLSGVAGGASLLPLFLGAAAGTFALLAAREFVGGSAALAGWVRITLEPIRRARVEGYLPNSTERRNYGILLAATAVIAGYMVGGPAVALLLACSAPLLAGALVRRGRRRYRAAVEKAVPDTARAIADSLSAGHSPRGALAATALSLDGPAGEEFNRLRHELELGRPTDEAVAALATRLRSERIDAFATALVSQRLAGGDLAALLRRFAEGAAERDRVAEDARSATAQARFTGYLVVAMPGAAAVFA